MKKVDEGCDLFDEIYLKGKLFPADWNCCRVATDPVL